MYPPDAQLAPAGSVLTLTSEVEPVAPVAAAKPVDPVAPVAPVEPVAPVDPVAPAAPASPDARDPETETQEPFVHMASEASATANATCKSVDESHAGRTVSLS